MLKTIKIFYSQITITEMHNVVFSQGMQIRWSFPWMTCTEFTESWQYPHLFIEISGNRYLSRNNNYKIYFSLLSLRMVFLRDMKKSDNRTTFDIVTIHWIQQKVIWKQLYCLSYFNSMSKGRLKLPYLYMYLNLVQLFKILRFSQGPTGCAHFHTNMTNVFVTLWVWSLKIIKISVTLIFLPKTVIIKILTKRTISIYSSVQRIKIRFH